MRLLRALRRECHRRTSGFHRRSSSAHARAPCRDSQSPDASARHPSRRQSREPAASASSSWTSLAAHSAQGRPAARAASVSATPRRRFERTRCISARAADSRREVERQASTLPSSRPSRSASTTAAESSSPSLSATACSPARRHASAPACRSSSCRIGPHSSTAQGLTSSKSALASATLCGLSRASSTLCFAASSKRAHSSTVSPASRSPLARSTAAWMPARSPPRCARCPSARQARASAANWPSAARGSQDPRLCSHGCASRSRASASSTRRAPAAAKPSMRERSSAAAAAAPRQSSTVPPTSQSSSARRTADARDSASPLWFARHPCDMHARTSCPSRESLQDGGRWLIAQFLTESLRPSTSSMCRERASRRSSALTTFPRRSRQRSTSSLTSCCSSASTSRPPRVASSPAASAWPPSRMMRSALAWSASICLVVAQAPSALFLSSSTIAHS
mmetsp:Transcript_52044/g.140318  ORF Transcript_52044/g.140318 Transcript_52044/m.140318 type:complete len:454 (+) Transcript_52044:686-2047(+)